MPPLDGRVAIVTGASRGLGKDMALSLARAGATVVAVARTESEGASQIPGSLADTVRLIKEAGGGALAVRCDVTRQEDIDHAVAQTLEQFGRIDILINNAAVLIPGTILDMQPRHWDLILRINLTGPFLFCRAVIPVMVQTGGGHVINVSSRGSIGPGPGPYHEVGSGNTSYGATKAALERFSQGLAAEVFPRRVSVNVLSPHRGIWSEGGHYFRTRSGTPSYTGWRMSGEVIGDAAALICSQEPGTFTGQILYDELALVEVGGLSEDEVMKRYPVEP